MRELPGKDAPAGCSSLFPCNEAEGFLIDFKHWVEPDKQWNKFKVKYVVCFPPSRDSSVYSVKFEAAQILTYLSINSIRWKGTSLGSV